MFPTTIMFSKLKSYQPKSDTMSSSKYVSIGDDGPAAVQLRAQHQGHQPRVLVRRHRTPAHYSTVLALIATASSTTYYNKTYRWVQNIDMPSHTSFFFGLRRPNIKSLSQLNEKGLSVESKPTPNFHRLLFLNI